jgi:hypothetical protein
MADPKNPSQEQGFASKAFQQVDTFVRGVANGMTFGAADYLAGAADKYIYDTTGKPQNGAPDTLANKMAQQRDLTDKDLSERHAASIAGHIIGGAALGVGVGSAIAETSVANAAKAVAVDLGLADKTTTINALIKTENLTKYSADSAQYIAENILANRASAANLIGVTTINGLIASPLTNIAGKPLIDGAIGIEKKYPCSKVDGETVCAHTHVQSGNNSAGKTR